MALTLEHPKNPGLALTFSKPSRTRLNDVKDLCLELSDEVDRTDQLGHVWQLLSRSEIPVSLLLSRDVLAELCQEILPLHDKLSLD